MKNILRVLSLVVVLLFAFTAIGCSSNSGSITVGGSTSVEPLAMSLAEAYEVEHPDAKLVVQGGGSSAGVKGCAEGLLDIGLASRELKPDEKSNWPNLVTTHVALDGVAIVVNPSVSIENLSLEEIRGIFAEGSNDTWTVISREEGSGTREVFEKKVMDDVDIAANAEYLSSNGAIKQKVASTSNAIGYISLGYVDSSVMTVTVGNIICNAGNCQNGSYPVSRYLNYITTGEPEGLAKAFIEYCLSTAGQAVVEEAGFISLG